MRNIFFVPSFQENYWYLPKLMYCYISFYIIIEKYSSMKNIKTVKRYWCWKTKNTGFILTEFFFDASHFSIQPRSAHAQCLSKRLSAIAISRHSGFQQWNVHNNSPYSPLLRHFCLIIYNYLQFVKKIYHNMVYLLQWILKKTS